MDKDINKSPKVTVLMPAYNAGRYISETIKSVLNQSFKNFELLIINDGSTDKTEEIINNFNDKRIRVIQNKDNLGSVASRNIGIKSALGEYIAILDADDISHKKRFEKQVRFLDTHQNIGVVGSAVKVIDKDGKSTGVVWKSNWTSEEIPSALLFHTVFAHSSVMFKKEVLQEENYRESSIPVEDYDLWVRVMDKWNMWNMPEALVSYRAHEGGISKINHDKLQKTVDEIIRSQLKKIEIFPSDEELRIHRTHDTYRKSDLKDFLQKRELWLSKLTEKNRNVEYYPNDIFERVVNLHWLKTCKANTHLGLYTWRVFWNSRLSKKIGTKELVPLIKFFIKCIIKKQD